MAWPSASRMRLTSLRSITGIPTRGPAAALPPRLRRSHGRSPGKKSFLTWTSAANHDPDRHAASYVDRILRGAKPGNLPVQFPTKYEMVANLETAKGYPNRFCCAPAR
jgi:hypothetical protein